MATHISTTSKCSRTSDQSCGGCKARTVCRCLKITEETIIEALTNLGVSSLQELRTATDAGNGCNCCHRLLMKYIDRYAQPSSVSSPILS
ncbi:MAG: (2Fe-2S)-binding protein [Gemmataceae bacterium]